MASMNTRAQASPPAGLPLVNGLRHPCLTQAQDLYDGLLVPLAAAFAAGALGVQASGRLARADPFPLPASQPGHLLLSLVSDEFAALEDSPAVRCALRRPATGRSAARHGFVQVARPLPD